MMKNFIEDPSARYSIFDIIDAAMTRYPVTLPEEYAALGFTPQDLGLKEYYEYSTTNILAMEYLAENITGQRMQDLVQDLVLTPLGLENSAEPPRDADAGTVVPEPSVVSYIGQGCVDEFTNVGGSNDVAVGYRNDEFFDSIVNTGTGGAMYSSITDLLQWAKSGVGDSLLAPETVAARHIFYPTSLVYSYGLGMHLMLVDPALGTWYGHDGDAFGSNARAAKNDDIGASFASAINSCGSELLHGEGMAILVKDLMGEDGSSTNAPSVSPPDGRTSAPSSEQGSATSTAAPSSSQGSVETSAPSSAGFGLLPSTLCMCAAAVLYLFL